LEWQTQRRDRQACRVLVCALACEARLENIPHLVREILRLAVWHAALGSDAVPPDQADLGIVGEASLALHDGNRELARPIGGAEELIEASTLPVRPAIDDDFAAVLEQHAQQA